MDLDKLFTFTDEYGNVFCCRNRKITLQLKSENRVRNIGELIIYRGAVIYKKFESEKQIFRKTNSWSLPKQIFNKVDGIWFYTNKNNYKILTKDVKEHVKYFHFCDTGYEFKIYIPLDIWSIDPIG